MHCGHTKARFRDIHAFLPNRRVAPVIYSDLGVGSMSRSRFRQRLRRVVIQVSRNYVGD